MMMMMRMRNASRAWMTISLLLMVLSSTVVVAVRPVLSIHGSGTTNPSKCFWHVMDKLEARAKLPLHLTYRAIGSGSGQTEFNTTPPVTFFGSGDIPLKKEMYDYLSATETILHLPIFVGAVSFFHSVPDTPTLNLTACTLAKIMKRTITEWDHPDIQSSNPELKIPSAGMAIRVARRTDGSSSTSGMSGYLANACPEEWSSDNTGSTIEWAEGTLECQGSGGVVACIQEEPGTIGYLEAGHGHDAGFEEIYLQNAFGTKLTSSEAAARGGVVGVAEIEGLLPPSASDDFSTVSLINQPGEFTWPITLLTYIYVRQDLRFIETPQEQALLKAFLQALYDDSYVQQCVDAYDFNKVTGRALSIALEGIDSLIVDDTSIPFQFELATNATLAAGDYYFSAKRQSANEVEIDILTTANEQLTAQVNELERLIQQTMLEVAQLAKAASTATATATSDSSTSTGGSKPALGEDEPQGALGESATTTTEGEKNQVAAALAMSIIAVILSGIAFIFICVKSTVPNEQEQNKYRTSGMAESA